MKKEILTLITTAALILTTGCGVVENVAGNSSPDSTTMPTGDVPADVVVTDEVTGSYEDTVTEPYEDLTESTTVPDIAEESGAPSPDDPDYAPAPVQYDIDGLTYIGGMLIANKSYSLPSDFNPGLDDTCYEQFCKLSEGAAADGLDIYLSSGFRSYDYQSEIYYGYVDTYGQASADTFSARPGYSEHQSGLAIDVNIIDDSFIGTPEAQWIEEHCYEYGFILRYPQGKQDITGYKYEPWHIRYVGTDLSYPIYESGLTVEEYFGITSEYAD